jgi:hypothetical protein
MRLMSKSLFLTVLIFSFLTVSFVYNVEYSFLVSANGFIMPRFPSISLVSPVRNGTYTTNTVPLIFTVSTLQYQIDRINYFLDLKILNSYYEKSKVEVSISENLIHLSEGLHRLDIYAYDGMGDENHLIVYFTIDMKNHTTATSNPSPSASTASLPPSPTTLTSPIISSSDEPTTEPSCQPISSPRQQSGFLGTNLPLEYGYAIVAVLVIIVVAGLSLVYFKKLRKQKVNS